MSGLPEFVSESNRIEGIEREPLESEVSAHEGFLALNSVQVGDLETFVAAVADAPLRDKPGMDVRVGGHFPPGGGPEIRKRLADLLTVVSFDRLSPFDAHVQYETLHPFLDGNGRSGRVLWAWMMRHNEGQDPFALPFLQRFYYQTLDAAQDSLR